jgi:hypothetical protein
MTVHETHFGDSVFYINRTIEGSFNYNRYNEKIKRHYEYDTALDYYKALKKAKKVYAKKNIFATSVTRF